MITFDFGDTLVSSEPPYLTRIWMGLKELGVERSPEQVEGAYHQADSAVSARMLEQGERSPARYQRNLGEVLLDQLGVKAERERLLEQLYKWLVGMRPERVLVPGAEFLLTELKKRGYPMGIISNNDGRTREKCRVVGIEEHFGFILDSTLEGMCKPDPNFFRKALELAGVEAREALHIGDLWGSDILGARAVGFWAVWIENKYLTPEPREGVYKVKRINQALEYLS